MSDSNSIKPLGLATSMVAGAAVGSIAPAVKNKLAGFIADHAKVDSFVKTTAQKAANAKNSVKKAVKTAAEKTKLDKAVDAVKTQAAKFANKVAESKTFQAITNSKFGNFIKEAAIKAGNFLKKPAVIGALVGALVYATYKMVKQHQENKAIANDLF